MYLYLCEFAFVYTHKCKRRFLSTYARVGIRVFTQI